MATPAQKKLIQKRLADIRDANNTQFKRFKWTGFCGKTLWDWMQLLIIPIMLIVVAYLFTGQQHQTDIQIAEDQQQETILQNYLDH